MQRMVHINRLIIKLSFIYKRYHIYKQMIPFNKPYLTGKEILYMQKCLEEKTLSGNGTFTQRCAELLRKKLKSEKCLLTTSCTDALEMCAMLVDIQAGDEVIVPSYTFVSSALAFTRNGAKIVFVDSRPDIPSMDETQLEKLITPRTKVIVVVHYAGVSCDMDVIMEIANRHNIIVVEDAAQAIDAFYKARPLGSIGQLSTFSFHATKNIQCGEGGMLAINDKHFCNRAETLWEKGTNRAEFFRGEVDKYGWRDTGSSFLPSDYTAAFLVAQIEQWAVIQARRKAIWERYYLGLKDLKNITVAHIPAYATNNAHMFYFTCASLEERTALIKFLRDNEIVANFHYQSLHKSDFMTNQPNYVTPNLPQSDRYTDCLLRLPFYYELSNEEVDLVINKVKEFYTK